MMFENVADLGDKIRAYDFAQFGEKASFIEGTVVDKGSCDDKYYSWKTRSHTKKNTLIMTDIKIVHLSLRYE